MNSAIGDCELRVTDDDSMRWRSEFGQPCGLEFMKHGTKYPDQAPFGAKSRRVQ
jgi:hypothetical protein